MVDMVQFSIFMIYFKKNYTLYSRYEFCVRK